MPHLIAFPTTPEEWAVYGFFCVILLLGALASMAGILPPPGGRTE
jgi:hypothetical protein